MDDEPFVIDAASLERAAAVAGPDAGTAQLVIVHRGEVAVDRTVVDRPVDVYAVQKALVSVLFGIAEERGLLRLDDPVSDLLGTGWTHLSADAEASVTIRGVLDMTTGMDDGLRPLGEVGVTWRYNNVAYNYLKTALEIATGRPLDQITNEWLLDPLGMTDTSWVERRVVRPDGNPITGMLSTAHDLARFGAMVLAGGDGIAPAEHVRLLGRPGSDENPSWGICWWNNHQSHHRLPGSERSGAVHSSQRRRPTRSSPGVRSRTGCTSCRRSNSSSPTRQDPSTANAHRHSTSRSGKHSTVARSTVATPLPHPATVSGMFAHHEAAQAAATGWLAIGGIGGVAMAARLAWARLRRR